MLEPSKTRSAEEGPWAAYHPSPEAPWDLRRVAHLHRRAGFAATRAEVERDLREGHESSLRRVLEGHGQEAGTRSDLEEIAGRIGDAAVESRDPQRLKAWWIFRMLASPDALGERLALMWHNHFATSNRKVDDLAAMRRQIDTFRRLARAPFGELLNAAVRDPALLTWLDAPANRKGHPNENLGRELMELFTLGIGHFTEADVKDAARALAGWTIREGEFLDNVAAHDDGEKIILGQKGRWTGADLVRLLLDHPATARRIAGRLCETFLGEKAVSSGEIDELAEGLRTHGLDVGWGVATILRSRAFFAEANLGNRVIGPVEFVVGAVRSLECCDPMPGTLRLAEWCARIGQDLFYPPNVGGWREGRAWLSTRGMVARANFATALASWKELGLDGPPAILRDTTPERLVADLAGRCLGKDPGGGWKARIVAEARAGASSEAGAARRAAAMILSSPEAQVG
ncbi:DUF1800 domain-containing protein [Aquisphaera insulae]|uniref:DUF1800 domain-containing protein n=1 Tax=Aquisphaera insulae TaxID=2712864 RepID=UPI0013EC2E35|nr:DUF1800 domain-containing protein [Aquisphaera insulae]